jgi:hypothetical protein
MRGPQFFKEVIKMKIYHAELTTEALEAYRKLHPDKKVSALISYGRRDRHARSLLSTHRGKINGLILDSGAFTLNSNPVKNAEKVTFEGYLAYLNIRADDFDFYFNFDADFSKSGFETNFGYQLDLEYAGLKPVPVVHDCYGDEIKIYLDRGHKRIAIGSGELRHAGLDELRHIVDPLYRKGVAVHFLGCTEYQKLAYLPVSSADSTTWNRTGSAAKIFYWNPLRSGYKKLDKITLEDNVLKRNIQYHIRDYMFRDQLEEYLYQELKMSLDDLVGKQKYLNRAIVNIHYFVLLEEMINDKHREQGFI